MISARQLVERTADPAFVVDHSLTIVACNAPAAALVAGARSHLAGVYAGVDHPSTRQRVLDSPMDTPGAGIIEVRIKQLDQLFDAMDPCPFYQKDLDRNAERYIVESVRELRQQRPQAVLVHLDESSGLPADEGVVGDAIRSHFARQAQSAERQLRSLIGRGWISLAIGLGFLGLMTVAAEQVGQVMREGPFATVVREGLLIGGWVAMWRPLEIFLYDWWPIAGERRVYERLSRIPVHLVVKGV